VKPGTGVILWKPMEFVTDPAGPYVFVMRDCWWLVNAAGEVAFYRSPGGGLHPQANSNKVIAERFRLGTDGAVGVLLVPLAFTPIRLEDYE
jgi:hypothetical protein